MFEKVSRSLKYDSNLFLYTNINTKINIQPFRVEYRNNYIEPKVEMFSEAEGRGKYFYRGCNICRYLTRKSFEYLVYYIGYSLAGNYCILSDVPIEHAQ